VLDHTEALWWILTCCIALKKGMSIGGNSWCMLSVQAAEFEFQLTKGDHSAGPHNQRSQPVTEETAVLFKILSMQLLQSDWQRM